MVDWVMLNTQKIQENHLKRESCKCSSELVMNTTLKDSLENIMLTGIKGLEMLNYWTVKSALILYLTSLRTIKKVQKFHFLFTQILTIKWMKGTLNQFNKIFNWYMINYHWKNNVKCMKK
jgi:hypothetical protein